MNNNRRFKTGLVLSAILCLINVPSALFPSTPDGETGPPFEVLVIGTVFGIVGLIATVLAWRGSSLALRVAAGCLIVNILTSLPALFVDVPSSLKLAVASLICLTIAALVLMFSSTRQQEPVTVAS